MFKHNNNPNYGNISTVFKPCQLIFFGRILGQSSVNLADLPRPRLRPKQPILGVTEAEASVDPCTIISYISIYKCIHRFNTANYTQSIPDLLNNIVCFYYSAFFTIVTGRLSFLYPFSRVEY